MTISLIRHPTLKQVDNQSEPFRHTFYNNSQCYYMFGGDRRSIDQSTQTFCQKHPKFMKSTPPQQIQHSCARISTAYQYIIDEAKLLEASLGHGDK